MTKRKKYQKPKISQVKLVPDDATLANCKMGAGLPGQNARTCDHGACKRNVFGS